jgi:DnaJ family protein C protein 13
MLQVKASKKVNFQDIVKLEILSDDEQVVLISLRSRTMRLVVKDSVAFVRAIQRNMKVRTFLPEKRRSHGAVW